MFEDFCTREGAHELAGQIERYWYGQGRFGIKTEIITAVPQHSDPALSRTVFGVRSNIGPDGFPPAEFSA